MYIKPVAEAIATLFLFLARVTSRPAEVTCGEGHREGDKWFDGCRWCVCQQSQRVCSSSKCSRLTTLVPPCQNVDSRWWDGCYLCQCHSHGIECMASPVCVELMRDGQLGANFQSRDGCFLPEDERCICGVDGVPSCTAEVIDKNAYPTVTIELLPGFSPPPFSVSPRYVSYDRDGATLTHDDSRKRSSPTSSSKTGKIVQENSPLHILSNTRQNGNRNYNLEKLEAIMKRLSADNQHGEQTENGGENKPTLQEYDNRAAQETATFGTQPSLLVASDNRCRWGVRWYGGSLRCYCGPDNSITCGNARFVASRIDGFRLEKIPCEAAGQTWEDTDTCTMCVCQASGIALCRRYPGCPLPFLITPHSEEPESYPDILEFGTDEKEDPHVTRETPGNQDQKFIRDPGDDIDETDGMETSSIANTGEQETFESKKQDNENINRNLQTSEFDNKKTMFKSTTPGWTNSDQDQDKFSDKTEVVVDITSTENSGENRGISEENISTNVPEPDDNSNISGEAEESTESDFKRIKEDGEKECTPGSRWLEGCKRCICSDDGRKNCDTSRCPKAMKTFVETTKASPGIDDKQYTRPMQRPPSDLFSQRDHPVVIGKPYPFVSCGRFKPGEMYWDDCNACVCTPHGPKCTAKSCS